MNSSHLIPGALLLLAASAAAQTPWVRQAHVPTWKNCLSITAPGDDEFFATAGALFAQAGDVLHNLGGTHLDWSAHPLSNDTLNATFFLDSQLGWAAGNGMFHTTDGGQSWVQDNNWGSMYDLFFVDALHGWAAGNGGIVYRTVDGGHTWSGTFAALSGHTARSVWFLDPLRGWAAGIGGHLSESADGGATWTNRYAGSYMTTVQFFDALEGWGLGGDVFVHTTDGGATWTNVQLPAGTWAQSGRFFDRLRGIAVGDAGNIVYTHDGGASWQTAQDPGAGPRLWDVEFSPSGVAVASGDRGYLLRSDDMGVTWRPLQSGAAWTTRGMDALDASRAWSANEAGEIGLTTDGGGLWERIPVAGFDEYGDLHDIDFADAAHGWAVGQQQVFGLPDDGRISRSTDGGRTWTLQFSQTALELFGVTAIDADTAIAYGRGSFASSAYLRTDDGGQTWSGAGNPAQTGVFRDAHFRPDGLTGWLVSQDIWHTTDGGVSWTKQYDGNQGPALASVSFASDTHGWASGFANVLLRTTDGGQTWTAQDPGGPAGAAYMAVAAGAPDVAVVAGWQGFVARTTDGGLTWTQETQPELPSLAAGIEWNAAVFLDAEQGWIGGNAGIYRRGGSQLPVGTALCFGDGGGAPCPCGNEDGGAPGSGGCLNGLGLGAVLSASGSPDTTQDTLVLTGSGLPAKPGLFLQGDALLAGGAGLLFGDGLRCCGGQVLRLEVVAAAPPEPSTCSTSLAISQHPGQTGLAGTSRCYQLWYRDPAGSPCGASFNLTNAVRVTWL